MMGCNMESLNLDLLPDEAKKQILELYQNILDEYGNIETKKDYRNKIKYAKLTKKKRLKEFFSKYNLKPVKFDREEANAR